MNTYEILYQLKFRTYTKTMSIRAVSKNDAAYRCYAILGNDINIMNIIKINRETCK